MKAMTPALQAHERLLGILPVRTVKKREHGIGRGMAFSKLGICKPIEVNHVVYESKNVARQQLHVASGTIDKMLLSGEARYVVPKL